MRLNIENKFFADVDFIYAANELDWSPWTVIGLLNCLWFGSQQKDCYQGSFDDICKWSRIDLYGTNEDSKKVIEALIRNGFLSKLEEDVYVIHGNKEQIEGRISRTEIGKKAANSRWGEGKNGTKKTKKCTPKKEKSDRGLRENPPDLEYIENTAENSEMPTHMHEHAIAMQGNARQCKAKQDNTMQGINNLVSDKSAPTLSKKNGVPAIWKARITPDDKNLAKQWFDRANELTPKSKYSLEKFEEALCRIRFDYKFTHDHLVQLFEFIKEDDFWKHNVVSPASLLKPSKSEPEITKLMQVVRSLKNKPKTEEELLEESFARRRAKEQQEANYFDEPIDVMGFSHD